MLAQALMEKGFAVLRFDFTGLGESEGNFADTNFTTNIGDLLAAADFLRQNYEAPKLIFGHSFGGAAALAAARHIPEAKALATINSPFEPAHIMHMFCHHLDEIEANGEAEVQLAGRTFTLQQQFIHNIRDQNMTDIIGNMGKALLIFHAPADTVVDVENARDIYQAAKHPKSYISLDGADHFLKNPADASFTANILSQWAARYI